MLVKIEWPDGSVHHYETDHAGVNRIANQMSAMYVMGELELVYREQPVSRSKGAGELQYATGSEQGNINYSEGRSGEQIDLEEAIKEAKDNGC